MSSSMEKVLQICHRHFFAKPVLCNDSIDHFIFGPVGELLKNNLYQEWLYSTVTKSDVTVFPYHTGKSLKDVGRGLLEPFEHVKAMNNGQLPFGIAVKDFGDRGKHGVEESSEELIKESLYFRPHNCTTLRLFMFVHPTHGMQFFDQWQRQRKIWWRKFSASPGRFSLADIHSENDGLTVHIQAEFSWGLENVETICHKGTALFDVLGKSEKELFEAKDGRRKIIPHVVESTINLDGAVFTFLCDAYDETTFLGLPREIMRFHRKLAPYKASFAAASSSASVSEELSQLALYLTRELRSCGILTLLLPDVAKKSLESQFIRNDELGIPYTAVLNDSSLKTGIIGLRSRDTTLKEQLHCSDLKLYMERLLKNY
ncbi:DNA polymerase subunit gamma-2, mitochondrial [Anabrus simplex]|uniref:DNA polymerase subunit gamma-2, mitochondrial n=1 Tax=Anabrus simplex TaxID=316456 RepID=UPI0035A369FE